MGSERPGAAARAALDAGVLDRVVARLRALEPAAVGVLVTGSYATGRATPWSDLDVTVLTALSPAGHYRTWFEPRGGLPLHVSAGAVALAGWVERGREPADWALGLPTEERAEWAWATDAARAVLGDPPLLRRPAAAPELEDFVEAATKVRRAAQAGDAVGARWHAHSMARRAPALLCPLNPERRVADVRDAVRAALEVAVSPPGYTDDLAACLGLRATGDDEVVAAAERLARAMLAFLRERKPDVDAQPDLARYLADGTLERHLRGPA